LRPNASSQNTIAHSSVDEAAHHLFAVEVMREAHFDGAGIVELGDLFCR
jgi:hypothetical protein